MFCSRPFLLIVLLCLSSQKILGDIRQFILGGTTLAALGWGCATYYKKLKLEEYLNQLYKEHKDITTKLTQEIALMHSESELLEKDQEFLAFVAKQVDNLEREYGCEYKSLVTRSIVEEDTVPLLGAVRERVTRSTVEFDSFERTIKSEKDKIDTLKSQLEVKMIEWSTKENREQYNAQGQKLLAHLESLITFFSTFLYTMQQQSTIIKLELLLDKEFKESYAFEINLKPEEYGQKLYEHIHTLFSDVQHQFPYVLYADKLKQDRATLRKYLQELKDFKAVPYQKEHLNYAKELDIILKNILDYVVTCDKYAQEKMRKPQFDLENEKQQIELRERQGKIQLDIQERQAVIEKGKREYEAQFQKELNKAQQLANQKAEIERSKKELELKEQEIGLEWAKLKEGEKLKEALEKNNALWQEQCRKVQSQYEREKETVTKLQTEHADLKKSIAQLGQNLQNNLNANRQIDKEQLRVHATSLLSLA